MLQDLFYRMRSLLRRQDVEAESTRRAALSISNERHRSIATLEFLKRSSPTAKIAIGGVEQARQQCREARGTRLVEDLWQDLTLWRSQSLEESGFHRYHTTYAGCGYWQLYCHLQHSQCGSYPLSPLW